MKTELMLMAMTDGRPVMGIPDIARLLSLTPATVRNKVYAKSLPFAVFKLDSDWAAHVTDVAHYIDTQRELALRESTT